MFFTMLKLSRDACDLFLDLRKYAENSLIQTRKILPSRTFFEQISPAWALESHEFMKYSYLHTSYT